MTMPSHRQVVQRRQLLTVSTTAIGVLSLAGCTVNSSGESDESEGSDNVDAETDDSNPEENTESSESPEESDAGSAGELVSEPVDSVVAVDESESVERPKNGVETLEGSFSINPDDGYGYHLEPLFAEEPTIIRWSITNERDPEHDFDVFFFTESQSGTYERVTRGTADQSIRYVPGGTVLGLEQSAERTVRIDPGKYYLVVDATEFGEAGANREERTIELTLKLEAWDA